MKEMEKKFYRKDALHLKDYSMNKARFIILLFLVFQFQISKSQTTKRAYFIGNSVTDAINYGGVDAIAESKGNNHIWGRHMIPGAPLSWLWTHPNDGFSEQPFGYPTSAFKNYEWDAISLQPFDRELDGTDGDVAMGGNYINLAKGKSPNVQFYIYSRWPRKATAFPENASGWNTAWTQTYHQSGGVNTNETKDYFEKLVYRLRTAHADIKPILMVPVGQVFHALNQKMAAGQVPGYAHIWQVYSDGIHLTSVGAYIAGVTFYSTMYKADPRGTAVPSQYGTIGSDLAGVIQQTVWEVVTKETLSGVSGVVSTTPTLSLRSPENPSGTTGGLDYSYFEGNWTNIPDFSTLNAAKTGTTSNFDLTVRNRDDNFAVRFTGYIDVPTDGDYTFYTSSDDGSKLFIGTREIVNNDGLHGATEKSGSISLKAGKHAITVTYFEATGGELLNVQYQGPGINKQTIPASRLFRVPTTSAANNPPKAVISANPTTGAAPLNVAFSASGSSDPDAGDFILGYEWNFGDGSALDYNVSPTHVYNQVGTYTVTLKVMDNRNLYSSPVTTTITVTSGQSINNGLKAEYFNNRNLTSPSVLTRTDGTVNFDWGLGSPSAGTVNTDDFSVRWSGQVEAPVSGSYIFSTTSDDGVRLWVNGVQVVNNWTNHASTTDNGTSISLVAGQKYDIRMEYYEATNGAVAKLLWAYPGQTQQIIPQNRLFPTAGTGSSSGSGLRAEYFNNRGLIAPAALTRTDGTVNFEWSTNAASGLNADDFSVRWKGQVEAPVSGSYIFSTTSDDGVRLWVNGVQVINNWTDHASTTDNGTSISLAAGQKYDIRMEFYEATGGAVAKLLWAYPGQAQQIIPQSRLFPTTVTISGTGSGLRAEYFNNIYLTSPASLSRTDATVNFDWGISAPASGVNADHFSVRWTGQVEAPVSGTYTFSTTSDDGVRLWVNGVQVINNWTDHGPTTDNGTSISLVVGQKYDIKMEYYERGGGAVAKLLWAFPGQTQQVIPQSRLYNATSNLREDDSFVISNITVAPNPASEAIYVMLPFEGEEVSVTLSNSIGEIFLQKSEVITHSLNVDLSNITPGMYFLTIRKGNLKHVEKVFVTK